MSRLDPGQLHTTFSHGASAGKLVLPRRYTLTHSDVTGKLFLTIAAEYDRAQVAGLYTRLMRDEVFAELNIDGSQAALHVYVHVSGGIAFGFAGWRDAILRHHMPMVLEAIRYGDRDIFKQHPELDEAKIFVHFASHRRRYKRVEDWGQVRNYKSTRYIG